MTLVATETLRTLSTDSSAATPLADFSASAFALASASALKADAWTTLVAVRYRPAMRLWLLLTAMVSDFPRTRRPFGRLAQLLPGDCRAAPYYSSAV